MKSIYAPQYRDGYFLPVVYAYYDRADMVSTTVPDPYHEHTLSEIMYVNEGGIFVGIDGNEISLGPKQFVWLDACVRHRLYLQDANPCSVMNIEFQLEEMPPRAPSFGALCRADPDLKSMMEVEAPYILLTDADGTVYNLMKQIILLVDSMHPEAESLCSWLTSQILLQIGRYRGQSSIFHDLPIRNNYVTAALRYISAHYLESITAREVAQSLHVQPTYLHKLFKEHMQTTIGEYINGLRIRHSRSLLKETNQTLLEIALTCGFSSQQRFTTLFYQATGTSPLEYRSQK